MIKWIRRMLSDGLTIEVVDPHQREKEEAAKVLKDYERRLLRLEATVSVHQPRRSP